MTDWYRKTILQIVLSPHSPKSLIYCPSA